MQVYHARMLNFSNFFIFTIVRRVSSSGTKEMSAERILMLNLIRRVLLPHNLYGTVLEWDKVLRGVSCF